MKLFFLYAGLAFLICLGSLCGWAVSTLAYYAYHEGYLLEPGMAVFAGEMAAIIGACLFGIKCIIRDLMRIASARRMVF